MEYETLWGVQMIWHNDHELVVEYTYHWNPYDDDYRLDKVESIALHRKNYLTGVVKFRDLTFNDSEIDFIYEELADREFWHNMRIENYNC